MDSDVFQNPENTCVNNVYAVVQDGHYKATGYVEWDASSTYSVSSILFLRCFKISHYLSIISSQV